MTEVRPALTGSWIATAGLGPIWIECLWMRPKLNRQFLGYPFAGIESSRCTRSARLRLRANSLELMRPVKIKDVRCTVVVAPWRELTFVELLTDADFIGISEVRMVTKTDTLVSCIRELAPRYVIGTSPFDTARLAWNFQRAEYGRPGEIAQSALSAFEIACWDLVGQLLGVPIYQLIGGRFRDRIPAYANGWYQTERDPALIATLAAGVVARGYRALKLDPFGAAYGSMSPPQRRMAIDIVSSVREAVVPDVEIMIEMHGRFAAGEASRLGPRIEKWDTTLIDA